jgi:predicted phage-related endonuclease
MKILNVTQGTDEWLALRGRYHTASEAPAMMGASSKCTRTQLLHNKATGDEKEYSQWVRENLLDRGHEIEATARTIVELSLGDDLLPATGVDDGGRFLASFDGLTMDGRVGFECKMWNKDLAQAVRDCQLTPEYFWQLEHQAMVADLDRIIFVCTDGTPERFLRMDYVPSPERRRQLIAGWDQFDADLASYKPAPAPVEVVPAAIKELPALVVQVEGRVVTSNLKVFKETALAFIDGIKTDLQTDQDFADAAKTVTFCEDGEKRLELVKAQALAQTASIDELFRAIDEIKGGLRAKRLELDKLVEKRKAEIRNEILQQGREVWRLHCLHLTDRIGMSYAPPAPDLAAAMKGKRTVASLRDAVDTALAHAKIAANEVADLIQINLRHVEGMERTLFPDLSQIATKPAADFQAIVAMRVQAQASQAPAATVIQDPLRDRRPGDEVHRDAQFETAPRRSSESNQAVLARLLEQADSLTIERVDQWTYLVRIK